MQRDGELLSVHCQDRDREERCQGTMAHRQKMGYINVLHIRQF